MSLGILPYAKGLHEVADGAFAWLAPDGSWGWSNAGLVVDGDASLLVDTLFDLALTAEMLSAMSAAAPVATRRYDYLVNTHANGDHCHGNELVPAGEIIASTAAAEEMAELPPAVLAALVASVADRDDGFGRYVRDAFGPFRFDDISPVAPTRTFSTALELTVGDTSVLLHEVGPAHTRGDVLVEVPSRGVVFTGDICFIEGTPIMWTGPVENWIAACERIERMGAAVVVPGHGPVTDARGVAAVRGYLEWVRDEATARHGAGMGVVEAAADIGFGGYGDWSDRERLVVNVNTIYRQLGSDRCLASVVDLFAAMADLR